MEDIVRYLIISIGIVYSIYKIKAIIWDKKYGCSTCNMKSTCGKKSCDMNNVKLSKEDMEKIKKIKLVYKN